jgi:hypothetical protein
VPRWFPDRRARYGRTRTAWRWNGRIVLGLALGLAVAAPAQQPPGDARCRKAFGKGVEGLAKTILIEQRRCHELRSAGRVAASLDCNDPTLAPLVDRVEHAASKLRTRALRRCARASGPVTLGYVTCPAPCGGSIADYAAVADCLVCLTESWLRDAGGAAHGAPPSPPLAAEAIRCQSDIARALTRYLTARLRDGVKCQFKDDRVPIGADCLDIDFTGAQAKALARAMSEVARCSEGGFAVLDSCAGTLAEEAACIRQLAEANADRLFVAVYRPMQLLPTPTATAPPASATATPTRTATVTATPTPSASPTPTPTATRTPTRTPTRTATATATATRTPTFTALPPTATATPSRTATATHTPSASATSTATPTLGPPQPCNPDGESYAEPAFYRSLAYRWAPIIVQDTASKWNADFIGRMDYDGDWRSNNNWDNLPEAGIAPYVYYDVVETATHWFLHYHTFHPRDWDNIFFGTCAPGSDCHENDTENLMVMVQKDGSTYGRFRLLETRAHNDFYQYALAGDGVGNGSGPDAEDLDNDAERGFTLFTDTSVGVNDPRPAVYVESKGHGICDWWDNNGPFCSHPDDMVGTGGNDGVMYYPSETATPSVPPNPEGGPWFDFKSPYRLISLWDDAWVLRSCLGDGMTFDVPFAYAGVTGNGGPFIGGAMDGDDHADDAATAWWAQSDDNNGLAPGDWTIDPADAVLRRLTFSEPVDTTYTFNLFLGVP